MRSSPRRESNTPCAMRRLLYAAGTSSSSFLPIERWSQILRTRIFHLACSNRGQSVERSPCLLRGKISAGEVSVEETPASLGPTLGRVHIVQRDGREMYS